MKKRTRKPPRQDFIQHFLTRVGSLQKSKAQLALKILRFIWDGLNQTQIAKELDTDRQQVNYWVSKFSAWGWIIPRVPKNDRAPGKYYKLSEPCQKFLTADEEQRLRIILEHRNRVDRLGFEAEILEADALGLERLKGILRKVNGLKNWNKYTGIYEDVSIEVQAGVKPRDKIVIWAGKQWGGRNSVEIVSKAQSACETYVRMLERDFGLKLSGLRLMKGYEFVPGNVDPYVRFWAAQHSKMENGIAKIDHSPRGGEKGELEFKIAEAFDDYAALPTNIRLLLAQQREIVSKLEEFLGRLPK
jgi:transposase